MCIQHSIISRISATTFDLLNTYLQASTLQHRPLYLPSIVNPKRSRLIRSFFFVSPSASTRSAFFGASMIPLLCFSCIVVYWQCFIDVGSHPAYCTGKIGFDSSSSIMWLNVCIVQLYPSRWMCSCSFQHLVCYYGNRLVHGQHFSIFVWLLVSRWVSERESLSSMRKKVCLQPK